MASRTKFSWGCATGNRVRRFQVGRFVLSFGESYSLRACQGTQTLYKWRIFNRSFILSGFLTAPMLFYSGLLWLSSWWAQVAPAYLLRLLGAITKTRATGIAPVHPTVPLPLPRRQKTNSLKHLRPPCLVCE